MKKVLVSLPEEIVDTVDNDLIGTLGSGRSDTLKTIIMNWLGEKGYLDAKGD
jgi:metal-responsive CopG/Arc/MetJ family transcriptional regulator